MTRRRYLLILLAALVIVSAGCAVLTANRSNKGVNQVSPGSGRVSPPYVKPEGADAYTIMIYLNGSDLESEEGSATADLEEMVAATFPRADVNVVVQTGGTKQWQDREIPNDSLARYLIGEDGLEFIEEQPLESMGDPDTLTDFINFAMDAYPADRFGLVLWNHGGGAVSGYGVDELFQEDGLNLYELGIALDQSYLKTYPLEFLGFDACLMANLETASMASPYARYLVASEELEPGYGWEYQSWLSELGQDPAMDGKRIGSAIVDSFLSFYNENEMEDEAMTLSVVDLSRTDEVVKALEDLIAVTDLSRANYEEIARPRSLTKEFGLPSEYGGSTDMIDLVHLTQLIQDLDPGEAKALQQAVEAAVVHLGSGIYVDHANGLSIYFPFAEKEDLDQRISVYQTTGFSQLYIDYVVQFASLLTGKPIAGLDVAESAPQQGSGTSTEDEFTISIPPEQLDNIDRIYFTAWVQDEEEDFYTQIYQDSFVDIDENGVILNEFDGEITTIQGEWACLYELDYGEDYIRYGVPAALNGRHVNLVLIYSDEFPDGKILGALPVYDEETGMAPKEMIPIRKGDQIALQYYTEKFYDSEEDGATLEEDGADLDEDAYWYEYEPFTVKGELAVEQWQVEEGTYLYGFTILDLQGNEYYTDFIEIAYE